MKYLLEHNILKPVSDFSLLEKGNIVRRVNTSKDQQGVFFGLDDEGGLILVNVISMMDISFETEAGILRPGTSDTIYRYQSSFSDGKTSAKAREILSRWPLYKKYQSMQIGMMKFLESSYAPEQIIDFEKTDNLKYLFVPIQQKFKIGKYEQKVNWNLERKLRFEWHLAHMRRGDHITYIAFIPPTSSDAALFYSIGTKPHESTVISLQTEPFNFMADKGGHIRCINDSGETKSFVVDTGSNYLGKGVKSSIETARIVTKALNAQFSKYAFTPVEGRGAFNEDQSY